MPVAGSSMTLGFLTVREPVDSALDVGTGSGYQALLASRHAGRVVATDANPTALEFARFNAALNRATNIEFREGSLFEPVAGERFDLVVSNPPFVISPEATYLFRDTPNPRDEVSRDVVRGAAEHLAPGGIATVLINWVLRPGADWWETPALWAADTGCDLWLLHHSTNGALAYAVQWNQHLQGHTDAYLGAVSRWVDHYRANDIGAVAYGAAILRRRDGVPWRRVDDLHGRQPTSPAGDAVRRLAALEDRLATEGGADRLLEERVVAAPHRLDQVLVRRGDAYEVDRATFLQDEGLGFRIEADPLAAELMVLCDGNRRLVEVLDELRARLDVQGLTDEEYALAATDTAIRMLRLGFLLLPV
jgi:methylase of polypeptide subunit release factors